MSEFGQDYRREVQDVNEGKSRPENIRQGIQGGESMSGKRTDRLETRGKREGMQGLLGFASQTLSGILQKQQQEDFHNAYASSVETAQGELDKANEESGFLSMIFGKNATQRGFHKRVLENETNTFHLQHLKRVKADATKYKTPAEYHEKVIAPALKAALEKQADPEMKADILKNFTGVAQNLGGQYVTQRVAYEQVLNRKATLEGVTGAINVWRDIAKTGLTPGDDKKYKAQVIKAFTTPPKDMEPMAHQDTVVNAIVSDLGQGNPEGIQLLEELQRTGKMKLDVENQEKINLAKETWIKENDFNFQNKQHELDDLVLKQNPGEFERVLKAAQGKYNINTNPWREKFQTQKLSNMAKAAELEHNIGLSVNGVAVAGEDGRLARQAVQDRIGNALVNNDRRALLERQKMDGTPPEEWVDLHKAVSPEEQMEALIKNPDALLSQWAGAQMPLPIVTQSQVKLSNLINQPKHSKQDVAQIEKHQSFLRRFEKRDPYLYAKQAPSKNELARNTAITFLMESDMPAIQAIQKVRQFSTYEDYSWDYENGEYEDAVDDVFDEAADDLGFTLFGGGSVTPENKEAATYHAKNALNQAIKIVKDPALAKVVARRFMLNNSTRVGDQLVFGGNAVDKKSVLPTNNYYELLDRNEIWKDKYELAGFPRNRKLNDEMNQITPLPNGAGMTVSSESPVDGRYIFVVIPAATSMADIPQTTDDNFMMKSYEDMQRENIKPIGQ